MQKFKKWFFAEERRHRHFQITITTGVIASTAVGYFFPYHGELAIASGVATNLIWIWEQ